MSIGLIFWILMLVWFIFGVWQNWGSPPAPAIGGTLMLFILLLLLGWRCFGPPIHG